MADKFEVSISSEEYATVNTPFPICQNVWVDFVSTIFPKFQVPPGNMRRGYHHGKYVNRKGNYDEISDGQSYDCYVHAYLPHMSIGVRRERTESWIQVPPCRTFYLEEIKADLEENPRTRTALLDSLRQVHAETIAYLLKRISEIPELCEYAGVRTTKRLRGLFGEKLSSNGLFEGCFSAPGEQIVYANLDQIPIGGLPLSMKGNLSDFLTTQTCLDFLKDLDEVLIVDKELNRTDLPTIISRMKKRYEHFTRS